MKHFQVTTNKHSPLLSIAYRLSKAIKTLAANENDLCDSTNGTNNNNSTVSHHHHKSAAASAVSSTTAATTKISPVVKMRWKQLARNAFNQSLDQKQVKQQQEPAISATKNGGHHLTTSGTAAKRNSVSNGHHHHHHHHHHQSNGFLHTSNLLDLLSLSSHHISAAAATQPASAVDSSAACAAAELNQLVVDSSSWVQLSGHEDSFALAGPGTIWKKRAADSAEVQVYESLAATGEAIQEMLPKYYRDVQYKGDHFIELEDLLYRYQKGEAAIMDIKMGSRTFLEAEVTASSSRPRTDLYEKMIKLDPHEPTAEEHAARAITKLRYMQFREDLSSSSNLGFRIEGFKVGSDVKHNKSLHLIKRRDEVATTLASFFQSKPEAAQAVVHRLRQLRKCFENSSFFAQHEVIGSSLLIIYTADKVGVFMIDFAKTLKLPPTVTIDHRSSWQLGNHEDGYLFGLDNLISVLEEVSSHHHRTSC